MTVNREDPAARIVDLFNPAPDIARLPFCETGTVVSPLPNLAIDVRGVSYKKERIRLDEYWVKGHEREIEVPMAPLSGSDSDGDSHISGAFPKAKVIFKDELKPGDKVAVLQSKDKQSIYVFFRVAEW